MFWVLKRTVSLRRSFEYPQHIFWLRNKKIKFSLLNLKSPVKHIKSGAQWLSGSIRLQIKRSLVETNWRCCVVSWARHFYPLLSTGSTQEDMNNCLDSLRPSQQGERSGLVVEFLTRD